MRQVMPMMATVPALHDEVMSTSLLTETKCAVSQTSSIGSHEGGGPNASGDGCIDQEGLSNTCGNMCAFIPVIATVPALHEEVMGASLLTEMAPPAPLPVLNSVTFSLSAALLVKVDAVMLRM